MRFSREITTVQLRELFRDAQSLRRVNYSWKGRACPGCSFGGEQFSVPGGVSEDWLAELRTASTAYGPGVHSACRVRVSPAPSWAATTPIGSELPDQLVSPGSRGFACAVPPSSEWTFSTPPSCSLHGLLTGPLFQGFSRTLCVRWQITALLTSLSPLSK